MGKPKKILKKRKRNSGVDSDKEAIPNTATSPSLVADDGIVCDILCRLPVKSLMRFKCVSKDWCSLIKDPYFIDLHSTTSNTPARLLFLIPLPKSQSKNKIAGISDQEVCFQTADLLSEVTGRAVPSIHTTRTSTSFQCSYILGAVNGLICFMNGRLEDSACIYNISTREVMPLVKSIFTVYVEASPGGGELIVCPAFTRSPMYCFGFDPATKQYKVMCNWRIFKKDGNRNIGCHFWEVLTLGNNSWRRIEGVTSLHDGLTSSSVYVNGSIYWFPAMLERGNWTLGAYIMAFDVGTEKFRRIQLPQFIIDQPGYRCPFFQVTVQLLESNGCLAIPRRTSDSVVKMWIHEVSGNGIGDGSWKEHKIILPGCLYKSLFATGFSFHSVAGSTDRLILEIKTYTGGDKKSMSLFSYNWQDETFEKMKIFGIPSSATLCTSFIESLFSFSQGEKQHPGQPST